MEEISIEIISNDLRYIRKDLEDIKRKLEHEFVSHDQFSPIRNIVYGLVSVILTSFSVTLVALVIRQP